MKKVGPFFKWFGSKWQSAKHYPRPQHSTIVEPFAGGAGYACNHSDHNVVLWDDDAHVRELWEWLTGGARPSDILDIPLGIPTGTDIQSLGLTRGQALLLKHWQRTNNVGDCWTVSPWGDKPGQWTQSTRSRLADELGHISHWKVGDCIAYVDEPSTWFIDPPYQFNYRYRRDLPDFDYAQLDSLVQTIHRDSLVIVCEAVGKKGEVPSYLPFERSHRSVTSRRKPSQSHHSSELVYVRKPSADYRW